MIIFSMLLILVSILWISCLTYIEDEHGIKYRIIKIVYLSPVLCY